MVYVVFGLYTLSGVDSGVRRQRLAVSLVLLPVDGQRKNPVSEALFLIKKLKVDNVQKVNYCNSDYCCHRMLTI
jgi:hypothetical protein